MKLIDSINFSSKLKNEFIDIQWKAREIATKLNPNSIFGFNINSTYQNEIYPEKDSLIKSEWESYDLNWKNFISLFPEYETFCIKYNFYHGCTMISRPIDWAHRHGNGQYTITFPLSYCDDINVLLITPKNINQLNIENKHWLTDNQPYIVDCEYKCKTNIPFMLKANHFHKTEKINFINGKSIFTVWHELTIPVTNDDLLKIKAKFEK